jgi:hypothetical protein
MPHAGRRLGYRPGQRPVPLPNVAAAGVGMVCGGNGQHAPFAGLALDPLEPRDVGVAQVRYEVRLGFLGDPAGTAATSAGPSRLRRD